VTDILTTTEVAPAPEPVEAPVVADAPVVPAEPLSPIESATRAAMDEVKARARDEQGRFAPKNEAAASTNSDPDSKPKTETAPSTAPVGPPVSWSADAKATWPSLSPAIQAAVLKRETEVSDGFRQKSEEAKSYTPVREILDSQKDRFARLGVDAPTALRQMFQYQDMLERDPVALIRHIANVGRVDIRQLAQTPTASASPAAAAQPARPNVAPDVSQIVDTRVREVLMTERAQTTLAEFETNPANKHAKDPAVRQAMAGALAAGAANLAEAYDRAVWSLPHLRETMMADRDATARKAAADKVEAAKRAAVGIKGGSPNGARPASLAAAAASGRTAEDAARAALASLRG